MTTQTSATDPPQDRESPAPVPSSHRADGWRETVESIVLALILAFLFRTFEAQAYQIPTGSMGPTLYGRHKDLVCPQCGYRYQVGASVEVDPSTEIPIRGSELIEGTCPLCRYPAEFDAAPGAEELVEPSYKGDKIWVTRTPYVLLGPQRFDVAVFRKPEVSEENYIKRLAGLPNETLRIEGGDLFVRSPDEDEFTIVRKPPHKVRATWLPVYDSAFPCKRLIEAGWPSRWQLDATAEDEGAADGASAWQSSDDRRTWKGQTAAGETAWLRYWHLVPDRVDWEAIEEGPLPEDYGFPRPQLISDFCAYNSGLTASTMRQVPRDRWGVGFHGLHWVGDLAVDCDVVVESDQGEFAVELVEAGQRYVCRFDVQTGRAWVEIPGIEGGPLVAETSVRGAGAYRITMANFDDRILLWIDDALVSFDRPAIYRSGHPQRPTPADLSPVGIGVDGATIQVNRLRIFRDIYYVAGFQHSEGMLTDQVRNPYLFPYLTREKLARFMATPQWWAAFEESATMNYELGDNEFFALGDNSPNSGDSRVWAVRGSGAVQRDQVLGKAFFVYWPHAWATQPNLSFQLGGRTMRVPFYPNVGDMRLIR